MKNECEIDDLLTKLTNKAVKLHSLQQLRDSINDLIVDTESEIERLRDLIEIRSG